MKRKFVRVNVVVSDDEGGEVSSQVYYELTASEGTDTLALAKSVAKEIKAHLDPAMESVGPKKRTVVTVDGKTESNGANGVP